MIWQSDAACSLASRPQAAPKCSSSRKDTQSKATEASIPGETGGVGKNYCIELNIVEHMTAADSSADWVYDSRKSGFFFGEEVRSDTSLQKKEKDFESWASSWAWQRGSILINQFEKWEQVIRKHNRSTHYQKKSWEKNAKHFHEALRDSRAEIFQERAAAQMEFLKSKSRRQAIGLDFSGSRQVISINLKVKEFRKHPVLFFLRVKLILTH